MTAPDDLREWAARHVADWPLPTAEQADLLRRTYGRVQPAHATPATKTSTASTVDAA